MDQEKKQGTSILFVNNKEEVLLLLRDNIDSIRCPNCWDMVGGHFEEGESPEECIIREAKEEIGEDIFKPELFKASNMKGGIEYTFWQKADFKIKEINLTEGQKLQWFSEEEIKNMPEEKIAFNFKSIILEFFKEKPYGK